VHDHPTIHRLDSGAKKEAGLTRFVFNLYIRLISKHWDNERADCNECHKPCQKGEPDLVDRQIGRL
jgi:hypothetical protein